MPVPACFCRWGWSGCHGKRFEDRLQPGMHLPIGKMVAGYLKIATGHFGPPLRAGQEVLDFADLTLIKEAVHGHHIKSQGLNIPDKRLISVYENWFLEVNGLQEGIAESFRPARKGDEIATVI